MPDPHIYPDPQVPLSLGAGITSAGVTIEQLTGVFAGNPNPTDSYMFIRLAISDPAGAISVAAPMPDVILQIDAGPASTVLTGSVQAIKAGATFVADGSILPDVTYNNVWVITLDFYPGANVPHTWTITIKNNDVVTRNFTWVVSGTETLTAQPWIDVEPSPLSWDVLINGVKSESVQITNRGTTAFTVNSVTPALPAGFTLGSLPGLLKPADSQPLTVTFTAPATPPDPDGDRAGSATVNISPSDSTTGTTLGHNQRLSVSAKTQALEIVLLLDDSGSMTWDPKGNTPADANLSRWSELKDAVNNTLLPLIGHFGKNQGQISVARFPETDPNTPTTFDLINPPINIDAAGITNATNAIGAVTPFFAGTPMGDGINRVLVQAGTYFKTDSVSVNANRRWLVLMTDGAQNIGTHQPSEFILPSLGGTAAGPTSFVEQNVAVFAIGYGVTGFSNVDPTVLTNLVASSVQSGQAQNERIDDATVTATQLQTAFRAAIKAGITPGQSPSDPSAVFRAGQSDARHFVLISEFDNKAAFVLGWNTPDANRMRLELITPTCDVITPEAALKGAFPDVGFYGGDRSQLYTIGRDFLRNAADPGRPRYGMWTMRVLSPELSDSRTGLENYDHDVIVDSDLQMQIKLDQPVYYAGDPIQITARITAAGRPVKGAAVILSTTAPTQSEANWLASLKVPADALKHAEKQVAGDSSALLIKTVGAGIAGMSFPGSKSPSNTAMVDQGGIGTYRATVTDTSTPEMHTFYVTAIGVTEDGSSFRREGKTSVNILVRPDAAYTLLDVQFGSLGTAQAVVTPRDRFENVLLINPATNPGLKLTVQNGRFSSPLSSNLDGSYNQLVTFTPGTTPVIGVSFNGQTIIEQTVPPIAKLIWVNKVEAFLLGAQAAPGANLHSDPKAALGDITTKPSGVFVSLGGFGALTVAVDGEAILAQGDDDINVFVQPDDDLRAYLVEALPSNSDDDDKKNQWVALGTSPGTTSSFSLAKAGLRAATSIRITDKSGCTRDAGFKPLSTPGVSIRAVGVKSVGEGDPGGGGGDGEGEICIRLKIQNPKGQPLGGAVNIEFHPQSGGQSTKVSGVDASKDIDVKGLQRFPQVSVYQVTVTPTNVFKPTSQFLTIPASGFNTVTFIVDKNK